MRATWGRVRPAAAAAVVLAALLTAGCGGDTESDSARDEPTSPSPSTTTAAPESESASPTEPSTSPAAPGECSPPTQEVIYGTGAATLDIATGEHAGTHELSTDPAGTSESRYQTGSGDQLIGNWRGTLEEELPALEVRMIDEGSGVCAGRPIVRLYLPFLAYTDEKSTACQVTLGTLTDSTVSGSFVCTDITRVFGTREPAALDVTGTFSLGT